MMSPEAKTRNFEKIRWAKGKRRKRRLLIAAVLMLTVRSVAKRTAHTWDDALIADLEVCFPSINQYLDDNLLLRASRKGRSEHDAIETLLKGKEIELPKGHMFFDKDGHARHEVRIRWFDGDAQTYQEAFLGPEKAKSHIPEDPIGADHLLQYSHDDPPVFIGHYWLDSKPELLAPNVACLDYSVAAKSGGKLVAYRWDGEQALSNDKFVYVERKSSQVPAGGC